MQGLPQKNRSASRRNNHQNLRIETTRDGRNNGLVDPMFGLLLLFTFVAWGTPPSRADVQLELHWGESSTTISNAVVEAPDGQRLPMSRWAKNNSEILTLSSSGQHVLHVQLGDEEQVFPFHVPDEGRILISYRDAVDGSERFQVEIDPRPIFSAEVNATARRRTERVLDVPISLIVRDDGQLEALSVNDLSDLGDYAPNLDFSISGGAGGAPSEATIYLRGVGQIEPGIFADPGVGIYVDGMYIARSQGSVLDLLDVERVEILRGPQGTLFGKNTTGGAIHLITRRPRGQSQGRLGITTGKFDRIEGEAGFEGPLSDHLNASLALRTAQRDGYTRSLIDGKAFNDENRWSARAAIAWQLDQATRVDVSVHGAQEREAALDQSLLEIPGAPGLAFYNSVLANTGQAVIDDSWITGDLYTSFSDFPSFSHGDVLAGLVRISYTTPAIDLLSLTGYRQYEYDGSSDFDGTPVRYFGRSYQQEQDQFSQEIQITGDALKHRLQFLLGGLYFEENPVDESITDTFGGLFEGLEAASGPIFAPPGAPPEVCPSDSPPLPIPCLGGAGNPFNGAFMFGDGIFDLLAIETKSWALFGEASLAINEQWSLSAGLRYTYEEKAFDFFTSSGDSPGRRLLDSEDWQAVSPRLTMSYQLADDVVLYASASHGFKSGGFNAGRSLSRAALNPYDQETLWAYEGGFKGTFLDHRLQVTGSVFHYDYADIQFASFLLLDGEIFLVIQNAAEAKLQGFELELEARPIDALTFTAAVGHVDSEYTDLQTEGGAPRDGTVPKTPEWTSNFSLQYVVDLAERGSLVLRGDVASKSKLFNDVANSPSIAQEGYSLAHARLMYAPSGDRWEIALAGTNLTDEEYLEHGFAAISAGLATGVAGRPREWSLSLLYRY